MYKLISLVSDLNKPLPIGSEIADTVTSFQVMEHLCEPQNMINEAIERAEPLYFELVDEIFTTIQNKNELKSTKQDENKATYSLWLDNEDYFIDWSWSADKIKRFVDAVGYPYDNAKSYLNDDIVKFVDVEIVEDVVVEHREKHVGKVIFIKDGIPILVCAEGLIGLNDIRDRNGNEMLINFRSRFK